MPKKGDRQWHTKLLAHDEVRRWYENLARKNTSTADVYLRRLGRTLDAATGKSPVDLLSLEQHELEDLVTDCISHELGRGIKGSTVGGFAKAIKSYLRWHGREIKRNNAIPGANEHESAEDEEIPSKDDLRSTLATSNARTAASLSLIAFGGLRPQVIGKIDASDGLRLRDLPELRIEAGRVWFETVPALVRVPRHLSKTKKAFFTFLGPDGCSYVAAYLTWRLGQGEELGPDSPLITPYGGEPRFCLRNNISDSIRRAMRSAGLSQRVYVWRSYFGNRCLMVESEGFLASWRKFCMGHTGDIQARYNLRKMLPEDMVEKMRHAYEKALPYLETGHVAAEDPTARIAALMLRAGGVDEAEIRGMGLEDKSEDEVAQILARTLHEPADAAAPTQAADSVVRVRQRVVPLSELETALGDGWTFKAALPGEKAVVEAA